MSRALRPRLVSIRLLFCRVSLFCVRVKRSYLCHRVCLSGVVPGRFVSNFRLVSASTCAVLTHSFSEGARTAQNFSLGRALLAARAMSVGSTHILFVRGARGTRVLHRCEDERFMPLFYCWMVAKAHLLSRALRPIGTEIRVT